jgi:uncharacterized protein YndB with AHSA1/START domain
VPLVRKALPELAEHSASDDVDASPERLYALVSDVVRLPDWSPECYRCAWLPPDDGPRVGARFRGWNRRRGLHWSTVCEVQIAEPGREFTFQVLGGRLKSDTRWQYLFEPVPGGTRVTESYAVARWSPRAMRLLVRLLRRDANRPAELAADLHTTLLRLKATADQR